MQIVNCTGAKAKPHSEKATHVILAHPDPPTPQKKTHTHTTGLLFSSHCRRPCTREQPAQTNIRFLHSGKKASTRLHNVATGSAHGTARGRDCRRFRSDKSRLRQSPACTHFSSRHSLISFLPSFMLLTPHGDCSAPAHRQGGRAHDWCGRSEFPGGCRFADD